MNTAETIKTTVFFFFMSFDVEITRKTENMIEKN